MVTFKWQDIRPQIPQQTPDMGVIDARVFWPKRPWLWLGHIKFACKAGGIGAQRQREKRRLILPPPRLGNEHNVEMLLRRGVRL